MSSTNNRIRVGDIVDVYLSPQYLAFTGEVIYLSQQTGDSWIIAEPELNQLHYVQTFAEIVKRREVN